MQSATGSFASKVAGLIAFGVVFLSINLIGQNPVTPNTNMYVVSPYSDSLWTIDTTDFSVANGQVMVATTVAQGDTIGIATSLTTDPCTGEIYIMSFDWNASARELGIVDVTSNPDTAWVTYIGNTGDLFAGIAFTDSSTLVGVTGDGASTQESYHTFNLTNGTATFVSALGGGSDGETIAMNYDDGYVYHFSGRGPSALTPSPWFARIDTSDGSETQFNNSGANWDEMKSSYYLGCGEFLNTDNDQQILLVNDTGLVASTGFTTHDWWKGMTFPLTNNFLWSADTLVTCSQDTLWVGVENNRGDIVVMDWGDGSANDTLETCDEVYAWHVYTPGNYNVTMTTTFSGKKLCNIAPVTKQLTVFASTFSPVNVATSGALALCAGDSVSLTADTVPNATYSWTMDGSPISSMQMIHASAAGSYKVTISDTLNGCTDSSMAQVVTVDPGLPTANYGQDADTLWVGQSLTTSDSSLNATSGYYNFGDGSANDSMLVGATHMYDSIGTFTVMQVVMNACGNDTMMTMIVVTDSPVAVIDPVSLENMQAFPNPFSNETALEFQLKEASDVSIKVFNMQGSLIANVVSERLTPGVHRFTWNGRDLQGNTVSNGTYLFQFKAGEQQATRQIVKID